jgi:ATP-binding cassette subfamily F protein uup
VENIDYAWQGAPVIKGFSTTIMRGDRVGIIGPNGSGKTTLLNLLLGRLQPDRGRVKFGTQLQVAYFDQLRSQLNEDLSVQENVGGGSDKVEIDGKSKHIISYLQDFLFTPERARTPVHVLSGGERNRLLLAKLFTKPANVLVLDEPTNDLDIETLELLEELLVGYQGTLLLVSHDREFLDHSVTSCLVFEAPGEIVESIGGYSDWEHKRSKIQQEKSSSAQIKIKSQREKPKNRSAKLSYKDQRELDQLPQLIEQLEQSLDALQTQLSDPDLYQASAGEKIGELQQQMIEVEQNLEQSYARWEHLESLKEGL